MEFSVNYSLELAELLREATVQRRSLQVRRLARHDRDGPRASAGVRAFPARRRLAISGRPANFAAADAMARETDTPLREPPPRHVRSAISRTPGGYGRRRRVDRPDARRRRRRGGVVGRERAHPREHPVLRARPANIIARRSSRTSSAASSSETGCGFLLDISHARIAAHYLGVDPHAYSSSSRSNACASCTSPASASTRRASPITWTCATKTGAGRSWRWSASAPATGRRRGPSPSNTAASASRSMAQREARARGAGAAAVRDGEAMTLVH